MATVLSFDSSQGDSLDEIKICEDDANYGTGSVYYLTLSSSTRTSIVGGTSQGVCSRYSSTSSQQNFAFYGHDNDELNA